MKSTLASLFIPPVSIRHTKNLVFIQGGINGGGGLPVRTGKI